MSTEYPSEFQILNGYPLDTDTSATYVDVADLESTKDEDFTNEVVDIHYTLSTLSSYCLMVLQFILKSFYLKYINMPSDLCLINNYENL